MGLDITVYQNLKLADKDEIENGEYQFHVYVIEESWKDRVKNLEYGKEYKADAVFGFGYSYTSHTIFRNNLAKITGKNLNWKTEPCEEGTPFYELINFADNEGVLDFGVSEKLYKDFVEWKQKALETNDDDFIYKYSNWLTAFNFARHGGAIDFH